MYFNVVQVKLICDAPLPSERAEVTRYTKVPFAVMDDFQLTSRD